jgi:CRP-like cAMP-binding protein
LSQAQLRALADSARQTWFESDELIFREGDTANRFYLIVAGKVALESPVQGGRSTLIQTIESGDLLGWSWTFSPSYWRLQARALEPTDAIFFYGTRRLAACEDDHDLGYELFRRVAEVMMHRLHLARQMFLGCPAPNAPTRSLRKS